MERCLEEVARYALQDSSWHLLLNAVCKTHKVSLPELLKSYNDRALESLKRSLTDPLITEAIEVYRSSNKCDRAVRFGFNMLNDYIPQTARLGDLDSRFITKICIRAEKDGRKRNTVRRSMLRAISLLLRFNLGNAERNRIFADVQFAGEDDTREIHLSSQEIQRLIDACHTHGYKELAVIIRLALQTSADRGVLLKGRNVDKDLRGLLVRDLSIYHDSKVDIYTGEIYLHDTKAKGRSRTVPLTDGMCRHLIIQCLNKEPDDTVFEMRYQQLDFQWKKVRKTAGLNDVRFKDLRAQTAIYGEEAGIPQTVLQKTMGHANEAMTRRYQQRAAALSKEQAEAIERAMFG